MAPEAAPALLLSPESDTVEILALSRSADYRIVRTFVQRMRSPNPKFYLGEGKVRQIAKYLERCKEERGKERRERGTELGIGHSERGDDSGYDGPAGEDKNRDADERPPAELRTSSGKCVRSPICPDGQIWEAGGLHPRQIAKQFGESSTESTTCHASWREFDRRSNEGRTEIGAASLPPQTGEARLGEKDRRSFGPPKGGGLLSDELFDDDAGPDDGTECPEKPRLAIFNGNLKPTQVFHLEKALGISVFDRIRLILEIFTKRANSPEARLQVELAHLQYDVPIIKEFIHRTRTGEHPGLFFAGGAYQVDEYYQMIKSRMVRIRRDLDQVGKERAQRRKTRRRGGQALVAIAGYTNAGKSALFRSLCSEEAVVGDELFTTLSTMTRGLKDRVQGPGPGSGCREQGAGCRDELRGQGAGFRDELRVQGAKVLVTDTVGFIRNLPPWLVEAFMSTLEEVFLSDAIILVADLSDEPSEILSKLETTLGILRKGDHNIPVVVAFNKTDLLGTTEAERRAAGILGAQNLPLNCRVSAVTGEGLPELVRLTLSALPDFFFGTISGPADELWALAGQNVRPEPSAGAGRASASSVLLRNWQVQELARNHESLVFAKSPRSTEPPVEAENR